MTTAAPMDPEVLMYLQGGPEDDAPWVLLAAAQELTAAGQHRLASEVRGELAALTAKVTTPAAALARLEVLIGLVPCEFVLTDQAAAALQPR